LADETPTQADLAGAAPAEETTMMSAAAAPADTAGNAGEIALATATPQPSPAATLAATPATKEVPAATAVTSPPAPEEAPKRPQLWLPIISLIILITLLSGAWVILSRKKGRGQ
jgi:hypothetical protein